LLVLSERRRRDRHLQFLGLLLLDSPKTWCRGVWIAIRHFLGERPVGERTDSTTEAAPSLADILQTGAVGVANAVKPLVSGERG
jgi:hypothetical protein